MVFWKRKLNQSQGFSLVEALAAITILGLVVVPIYSSMMLSYRLNLHSERTLQAQLAVSAAVETIMAEGLNKDVCVLAEDCNGDCSEDCPQHCGKNCKINSHYHQRFPNVKITCTVSSPAIQFTVTAKDPNNPEKTLDDISVTTWARPYAAPKTPEEVTT